MFNLTRVNLTGLLELTQVDLTSLFGNNSKNFRSTSKFVQILIPLVEKFHLSYVRALYSDSGDDDNEYRFLGCSNDHTKKGDRVTAENYHPVSLTSHVIKILKEF